MLHKQVQVPSACAAHGWRYFLRRPRATAVYTTNLLIYNGQIDIIKMSRLHRLGYLIDAMQLSNTYGSIVRCKNYKPIT